MAVVAVVACVVLTGLAVPAGAQQTESTPEETDATSETPTTPGGTDATPGPTNATRIDSCTTITESGRYVLSSNVTGPADQSTAVQTVNGSVSGCVVVAADDVILDGQGNSVGATGTAVGAGTAGDEVDGDGAEPLPDEEAISGTETPAESAGIVVVDPDETISNVTVTDVAASGWYWGIVAVDARNVTVSEANLTDNVVGVETADVTESRVEDTTATDNAIAGVTLGTASETVMNDSRVADSGVVGVNLVDSRNVTVSDSTVTDSGVTGVALTNTTSSLVADMAVSGTANESGFTTAVALFESSNNTVDDILVTDDARWSYYGTNGSLNNTADILYRNGSIEVFFIGGDAAFKPAPPESTNFTGIPVVVTNTSDGTRGDVSVTWRDGVEATDGAGGPPTDTTNRTTSDENRTDATNRTTSDGEVDGVPEDPAETETTGTPVF
jgi:hypothetical protein